MNEHWPSEHHAKSREAFADSSFKNEQDFLDLLDAFPNGLPRDFDEVVAWIVNKDGDLVELEQRIVPIVGAANLQTYLDSQTLLMTLACAAAFARSPSLQTWCRVKAFKYNSWQLARWLSEAMMAYVQVTLSARDAYVLLAKEVFSGLENFSLQSKFDRTNKERASVWNCWNKRQDKLEEIWCDLRGGQAFMIYEEELSLFQVFYKLEPDEFIHTISGSANPYLVSAMLFVAGIGAFSPRFSEWKRMIAAAPPAFEDGGRWNGSVLMPLLLVEARSQLLQVERLHRNPGSTFTSNEIDEVKQEITSTAKLIVTILVTRQDALAIFVRWAPWLIRQILGQTSMEIDNVTSPAFADDALIAEIGRKLGESPLPQASPDDAPLWEAWCYQCVLSSLAYNGHIQAPAWEIFGNEWRLLPEDWVEHKGQLLRAHASLIGIMNKEIPGMAANLLAYPIAQSSSPTEAWIALWNDAITLREIVEFGDSDAVKDEYSSRSEAGKLLLLLFGIGLAIFDQGAARSTDNKSTEARSLVSLFTELNSATCEMREIDSTLNHDKWLLIVQHLAIRRMIWEYPSGNETTSMNPQVFKVDDTPTVSDILSEAKGNVIELVAILQSLLLNSPDASRLKANLNTATIDLFDVIQSIRSLNQSHPRKYPIDEAQLRPLEGLLS
ncbi:hypothetical protein GL267_006005 [Acidithiobacillus ferrianus]|uniref:Uncharacterized protein n=2 Tax=Acidithiobacillus ferrianus TaxID=2678518 RepID=A0A845U723_9PROT|nr:hypothetical protein [Acidithiobacillus ferrianus]NDU41959.1 hypothetical protein [Acidithiobacillus ferrianus]